MQRAALLARLREGRDFHEACYAVGVNPVDALDRHGFVHPTIPRLQDEAREATEEAARCGRWWIR